MTLTVIFSFRNGVIFATTHIAGAGVVVLAIGVGFGLAVIQVKDNLSANVTLKNCPDILSLVVPMACGDISRLQHCARSGHGRRICHDERV